ncbi:MAG: ribosomal protein S18-alanine N-acetyltransferase [Legionellales bacterium]|nr:ribosomal protein S18-alanine N-acetyltransferase [Legionellales bacterium]
MKSEIIIRTMRQEDVWNVKLIEDEVQIAPWSEQIFRDCIDVGYSSWVMMQEEIMLGFAMMSSAVGEAHLLNISLAKHAQHQGHGQRLMNFMIAKARELQMIKMFLEVRVSNQAAIQLYKKLGFTLLSMRKDYYPATDGREDALVMVLNLT